MRRFNPHIAAPRTNLLPKLAHWTARAADAALETLYPTRCVGCDLPGELICEECRAALPWIDQSQACPNCGGAYGSLTCTQCTPDDPWPTRAMIAAMTSSRISMRLVTVYKEEHEQRLAPVIAAAIATALDEAADVAAADGAARFDGSALSGVCFVPATAEAYERRGFDHMELVARSLAGMLDLPLVDVLARRPAEDQRLLGRAERAENLAATVEVLDDVSGLDLLLVDDVVTTGASICACADALLKRGAASVTACALVRVW